MHIRQLLSHRSDQILLALVLTTALCSPAFAEDAGQKEFLAQGCNKCHSVESHDIAATIKVEKMKGPDMSQVGTRRDRGTIKEIVLKKIEIEGHNHKGKWEGKDKDLDVIANWLAALK